MQASTIVTGSLLGRAEADLAAANQPTHKSELGKDDFLKLLVAQLGNQDPMNPMEDKEFTAQMAEFSSLEQLTNIADGIDSLNSNDARQEMMTAVSFIGKDVRAQGYNVTKEADAMSTVYYGFSETVANCFVNIYDENGNLVRTETLGSKQPGTYEFNWDGLDWGGNEAPDGVYSIAMAGETIDGQPVMIQTEVSGEVAGVVTEGGSHYLRLKDGRFINFANVKEVVDPEAASDSPANQAEDDPENGTTES